MKLLLDIIAFTIVFIGIIAVIVIVILAVTAWH